MELTKTGAITRTGSDVSGSGVARSVRLGMSGTGANLETAEIGLSAMEACLEEKS